MTEIHITITINAGALEKFPFDLAKAVKDEIVTLEDPAFDDEQVKDVCLMWPCEGIPFATWMKKYAAPLLAQGAGMALSIRDEAVTAGLSTITGGHDPHTYIKVDALKFGCCTAEFLNAYCQQVNP